MDSIKLGKIVRMAIYATVGVAVAGVVALVAWLL